LENYAFGGYKVKSGCRSLTHKLCVGVVVGCLWVCVWGSVFLCWSVCVVWVCWCVVLGCVSVCFCVCVCVCLCVCACTVCVCVRVRVCVWWGCGGVVWVVCVWGVERM